MGVKLETQLINGHLTVEFPDNIYDVDRKNDHSPEIKLTFVTKEEGRPSRPEYHRPSETFEFKVSELELRRLLTRLTRLI